MGKIYEICPLADLEIGNVKKVSVEDLTVAVVRVSDDEVRVIDDRCSHADYSLSEGEYDADERSVTCWKHGAAFSLLTGEPSCLPATKPVRTYDVQIENSVVKVVLDDE